MKDYRQKTVSNSRLFSITEIRDQRLYLRSFRSTVKDNNKISCSTRDSNLGRLKDWVHDLCLNSTVAPV